MEVNQIIYKRNQPLPFNQVFKISKSSCFEFEDYFLIFPQKTWDFISDLAPKYVQKWYTVVPEPTYIQIIEQ